MFMEQYDYYAQDDICIIANIKRYVYSEIICDEAYNGKEDLKGMMTFE